MLKLCRCCGALREFDEGGMGTKARGFHGKICYGCYLSEQRAWRGTALGREQANEASRATAARRRPVDDALRDVLNARKEATSRRNRWPI